MTRGHITPSLLLSGLLAFAGLAQAQSGSASATSDIPVKAGEASTLTQGRPNAQTTNATGTASTGTAPRGAGAQGGAAATSSVPDRAGEASTMLRGRPNADTENPALGKSASQIREEKDLKKAERQARRQAAVMSQKGAHSGAPAGTSYNTPAGTPPVQAGGTPK